LGLAPPRIALTAAAVVIRGRVAYVSLVIGAGREFGSRFDLTRARSRR